MARKAKTKRKTVAKKRARPARKKARAGARKTVARKPAKRAAARKPAGKRAGARAKAAPARRAAKPVKRAAPKAAVRRKAAPKPPAPAAIEIPAGTERVGSVVHYYGHISVAVVRVDQGALSAGDTIRIKGHTTDFTQPVDSMEIDHQPVGRVEAGQEAGLKVAQHAREHDQVYRVLASGA